ncbi:MAG: hypothetical protein KF716_04070 [Anaerolineae bacterium]|nr:hypothetical protein [Anaerolineae bacterium]
MPSKTLSRKTFLLYLLLVANILTLIIAIFTPALNVPLATTESVRNGVLLYALLALEGLITVVIGTWLSLRFLKGQRDQILLLGLFLILAGLAMLWWFSTHSFALMLYDTCAFYQQCL